MERSYFTASFKRMYRLATKKIILMEEYISYKLPTVKFLQNLL